MRPEHSHIIRDNTILQGYSQTQIQPAPLRVMKHFPAVEPRLAGSQEDCRRGASKKKRPGHHVISIPTISSEETQGQSQGVRRT